jgi:phosphatidylserine decarboxylase
MRIAREGLPQIAMATVLLGALGALGAWWHGAAAVPFVVVWVWVISFFRDPVRRRRFEAGALCSPADGTITEIVELESHDAFDGPAIRIGVFLSLFNVHINRSPCAATVRSIDYRPGLFLDARHRDSGRKNESNTLLLDPDGPMPGPVVVRQVAGLVARRIICHAKPGDHMATGHRFGLIKFGSRTELIIPKIAGTEVVVRIGDKVKAGLTPLARQRIESEPAGRSKSEERGVAV